MDDPEKRLLGFWETVRQNTHLKQYGTSQIGVIATINGPLTHQLIKQALHLLFIQQPLLRARIEKKDGYYWFILDRKFDDIPFTVVERYSAEQWKKINEQELAHPVPTHQYLWKAVFVHSNEKNSEDHELLLFFHHAIADGLSIAHAIKNVLHYCQQLVEGEKPQPVEMPLVDCVEKSTTNKLSWDAYIQQLQASQQLPQLENWHYLAEEPIGQRVTKGLFLEASYEQLLVKCREEEVTINSAIAAALIYSGQQKKIHKGPLSILTFVDLRKYCDPILTRDYLGCYVAGILTKHQLTDLTPLSFWNLAREYQQELQDKARITAFTPYEFLPQVIENFSITNPLGALDKQKQFFVKEGYTIDFCLTNLGRIDIPQDYGCFKLKKFYFCTSRQAGAIGCIANIVTFPDSMFLCFGYADPLLNTHAVNELTDVFCKVLSLHPPI